MSEPGVYSCAQCVGRDCAQAGCNLSCEYFPNGCQTIVSGFMSGELEIVMKADKEDTSPLPLFSGVPGLPLQTVRSDLAAKDVKVGDVLTHINNEYVGGDVNRLAELAGDVKVGDSLTFLREGKRHTITL